MPTRPVLDAQRSMLYHRARGCCWCGGDVVGLPFTCQECPSLICCSRCLRHARGAHGPTHCFKSTSGRIYSASGGYLDNTDLDLHNSIPVEELNEFYDVGFYGYLVDTVRATSNLSGAISHLRDGYNKLSLPALAWIYLDGMESYLTKQDSQRILSRSFFRTLIGNRMIFDDEVLHPSEEWMDRAIEFLHANFAVPGEDMFQKRDLSGAPPGLLACLEVLFTARAFGTTKERCAMGFFPWNTEEGDTIAILMGCSVPVVLRKTGIGDDEETLFTIIGECYVDGIMEGEYMYEVAEKGLETRRILVR
ncbi:uncharacterized protein B0I36DRAFT_332591 [Microdochium trichocladiopsis]|uniref:Suppressor of anucleate metulae protein B n=1 Tax=Microdochium trichocladiopsis TaxID=1682393 RepID=A0A9P9BLR2_9PEZI|nr:uncharacterized protein B0I36DRAFT_332591 [Microdochium trichocladiopsis]KAH7025149.1 hypothetical protein B0I36DRAFT_332591 [Microdochium trichocladiopsis]